MCVCVSELVSELCSVIDVYNLWMVIRKQQRNAMTQAEP